MATPLFLLPDRLALRFDWEPLLMLTGWLCWIIKIEFGDLFGAGLFISVVDGALNGNVVGAVPLFVLHLR